MLYLVGVATLLALLPTTSCTAISTGKPACRYLPGDAGWPTQAVWDQLNQTVGGRLIRGVPLGQPCHGPELDPQECSQIQEQWTLLPPL